MVHRETSTADSKSSNVAHCGSCDAAVSEDGRLDATELRLYVLPRANGMLIWTVLATYVTLGAGEPVQ